MEKIQTPTIGEFLLHDFMLPKHLTPSDLASNIGVSTKEINDILENHSRIDEKMSLRLARFFGVSDDFFYRLQMDIDQRNSKEKH